MQKLHNIYETIHHNIADAAKLVFLNVASIFSTATIWSELELTVKIAAGFGNLFIAIVTIFWIRGKMKNTRSQEELNQLQIEKLKKEIEQGPPKK